MTRVIAMATRSVAVGAVLVLAGAAPVLSQAQIEHSSPAIRGRILEDRTGRPVPHAHIVAAWHGNEAVPLMYPQTVKLIETISAGDGSFLLQAWGPVTLRTPVSAESPILIVWAPGRGGIVISLSRSGPLRGATDVSILPLPDAPEKQAEVLVGLAWQLAYAAAPLPGQPKPRMLAALEAEYRRLPQDEFPQQAKGKTLTEIFDWSVQEFRRAIEYRALEREKKK
jgi:hypothetical protein